MACYRRRFLNRFSLQRANVWIPLQDVRNSQKACHTPGDFEPGFFPLPQFLDYLPGAFGSTTNCLPCECSHNRFAECGDDRSLQINVA